MIEKTKNAALVAIVMVLCFAFGWTSNGYRIYKSQFNYIGAVTEALK